MAAAGKAVLRLARFEALAGLVPLVEHGGWLTAEPDALGSWRTELGGRRIVRTEGVSKNCSARVASPRARGAVGICALRGGFIAWQRARAPTIAHFVYFV